MLSASMLTVSPTFNSYSSTRFAEIASRVVDEVNREGEENEVEEEMEGNENFRFSGAVNHFKQMSLDPTKEEEAEEGEICGELPQRMAAVENAGEGDEGEDDEDDDDFEFAFVPRDPEAPPITADEMFANGEIRPIWPIFNRDVIFSESDGSDEKNQEENPSPSILLPMRKLLKEDRSPSSSESNSRNAVPAGSYCVWAPKAHRSARPESSASSSACPGRCKKSNSTGSSKVWRFRDLMHRSSSNGQDTMVFLSTDAIKGGEKKGKAVVVGGKKGEKKREVSAHEIYLRNRMMSEGGDRRRSFLPYRQDLVGFFANVNGLSRSLHPF